MFSAAPADQKCRISLIDNLAGDVFVAIFPGAPALVNLTWVTTNPGRVSLSLVMPDNDVVTPGLMDRSLTSVFSLPSRGVSSAVKLYHKPRGTNR